MLKQRVVTALILGALALAAIFLLPQLLWGLTVTLVVLLATREWCTLLSIPRKTMFLLMLLVCIPPLFASFIPIRGDGLLVLLAVYGCAICFWTFTAPSWLHVKPDIVGSPLAFLVGLTLFVPTSLAMVELRRAHPGLLVLAILAVCIADIAAFFVGRAYGKRKLAPTISPAKSWEGFYGGVAGVLLFFVACAIWLVPALPARIGFIPVVVFAVIYALASVEGDLFESFIKRKAGVKDSGNLLPGHGGVLDRVDSMLSTLPLAGALLAAWQYF